MVWSGAATPKLPYSETGWNPDRSDNYNGMDAYLAEYRQDNLVQGCIHARAYFSVGHGFDTVLDLTDPGELDSEGVQRELSTYRDLKDFIDRVNRMVGLDDMLRTAEVKREIYGWCGFEIVKDAGGVPVKLLSRRMERSNKGGGQGLEPELDGKTGDLVGFKYQGKSGAFEPEEILWFTNGDLEDDYGGVSLVEPIFHQLATRRFLMSEAFKETAKALWAPYISLKIDTGEASEENARKMMQEVLGALKPGKPLVVNQDVEFTVTDQKPRIEGLIQMKEIIDQDIIGNFQVPRFLLVRGEMVNRATAFAEGALFIQGPVNDIQRYLGREVERQWYDMLTRLWFKQSGRGLGEEEEPPVKVKHRWEPVTINDFVEEATTWAMLYEKNVVDRFAAIEGVGLDPAEIEKRETETPSAAKDVRKDTYDITDEGGKQYRVSHYHKGSVEPPLKTSPPAKPDELRDEKVKLAKSLRKHFTLEGDED